MSTPDQQPSGEPLQFDAVEPAHPGSPAPGSVPVCAQCRQEIESQYYEIRGHIVCAQCKTLLEGKFSTSAGALGLGRALIYGLGAAAAGAAAYYAVYVLFHVQLSLLTIGIGWIVGRAVQLGSGERRGWQIQGLGVGLTWVSIAVAYVAMILHESDMHLSDFSLPRIFALPITINFNDSRPDLLGLAIVCIGLYQAWRMNKGVALAFNGPYQVGGEPPARVPAA